MAENNHQADDPSAAPGDLELVRAFINTRNLESNHDELESVDHLHLWLVKHGLLAKHEVLSESDRQSALEVREALRALLLANNGAEPNPAAVAVLNRETASSHLIIHFEETATPELRSTEGGLEKAFGRLLGIIHTAFIEGSWLRLKACRNNECQWAFFDHSKNRSGTWCTMAVCGSRMKARAYRKRRVIQAIKR